MQAGHTASYYYIGKSWVCAFATAVPFGLTLQEQDAWLFEGGSRDAVLLLFFTAVAGSASKPGVIPIFLTAIIVFWSMLGGLFFLFDSKQEKAEVEELVEEYLEQGESPLELETPTHA